MLGKPHILSLFCDLVNEVNNTRTLMKAPLRGVEIAKNDTFPGTSKLS